MKNPYQFGFYPNQDYLNKENSMGIDLDKFFNENSFNGKEAVSSVTETTADASSFGDKLKGNIGNFVKFGANQYSNFNTVSGSDKESNLQIAKSGIDGAMLGMKVGGPLGAAVGGVAGAALGFIDKKADTKKRIESRDEKVRDESRLIKENRYRDYMLSEGEAVSQNQLDLAESQMKFINKYQ